MTLHYFLIILFIQLPKSLPWCMAHLSLSSQQACLRVYQCQLVIDRFQIKTTLCNVRARSNK